jgi:hypothetical protein
MTNIENTVERINQMASKSQEMPNCFRFSIEGVGGERIKLTIRADEASLKSGLRMVDPWLMTVLNTLRLEHPKTPITDICVRFLHKPKSVELESFCRRLSYLAINNTWKATILVDGQTEAYCHVYPTIDALLERPADEVVREECDERHDNPDSDGKIEKQLQTWLAGERRSDNERLALLGPDFIFGKSHKSKVIREFPTGSFRGSKSSNNRILPTYWVDLVTLNKSRQLAIIELKVNDGKLDVLAQALDYALFFSCYRKCLSAHLSKDLDCPVDASIKIACYVASNCFHPKFLEVSEFYSPKSEKWPFMLKQCELGRITTLTSKNKL